MRLFRRKKSGNRWSQRSRGSRKRDVVIADTANNMVVAAATSDGIDTIIAIYPFIRQSCQLACQHQ